MKQQQMLETGPRSTLFHDAWFSGTSIPLEAVGGGVPKRIRSRLQQYRRRIASWTNLAASVLSSFAAVLSPFGDGMKAPRSDGRQSHLAARRRFVRGLMPYLAGSAAYVFGRREDSVQRRTAVLFPGRESASFGAVEAPRDSALPAARSGIRADSGGATRRAGVPVRPRTAISDVYHVWDRRWDQETGDYIHRLGRT